MNNKSFDSIKLEKIKINVENNNFWVVPSSIRLFTPKRKDFIVKKAKNLEEIYKGNNMQVGNYYLSFNRDYNFKLFNELQKLSCLKDLKIDKNVEKIIEKDKNYIYKHNNEISLKFDEKNLYKIFKGNSFLINDNYFENYVEILKLKGFKNNEWIFYWNGRKFELSN